MDLSKISIKLRPRNGYAAVDLGIKLAQKNWKQMFFSAAIFTLPLFISLLLIMPSHPVWVAIIIWWLKPLWERPLLLIISQDVFHQHMSMNEIIRTGFKLLFKQCIQSLTFRRFSPTRSFDAPVMQLESLSGKERRERLAALHSRSPSSISAMTMVMHLIEQLMAFGVMFFILQFLPTDDVEWIIFLENIITNSGLNLYYLLLAIGWYLAMLVVAPFYVAGGFSSYLNQRSIREAWDLELIFRQLASKHKSKKFDYQNLTAALLLCLFSIFSQPTMAENSSEIDKFAEQKAKVKREIERIQEGPDYKRIEQDVEFRSINPIKKNKDEPEIEIKNSDGFFGKSFAKILSWIFIIALIIFILFKLPAIIEYFKSGIGTKNERIKNKEIPDQLFGLDLKQESLPDDIVGEAKALWQQSKHREALGLLYRASLSKLIHDYECEFEDGFTELECLSIVEQKNLSLTNYFSDLTQAWRLLAYGHKLPNETVFQELATSWPSYFLKLEESEVSQVDADG